MGLRCVEDSSRLLDFKLWSGAWVVSFPRGHGFGPDWRIIRSLFRFGLPTGIQGIAMNVGGVLMLAVIGSLPQSAAAQAAFAVSYTQLFSLITWTSVGLMGAAAAVAGQNLGAGRPDRADAAVHAAARFGFAGAAVIGFFFWSFTATARDVGMNDPDAVEMACSCCAGELLDCDRRRRLHGAFRGRRTRFALHLDVSQIVVPLGICF